MATTPPEPTEEQQNWRRSAKAILVVLDVLRPFVQHVVTHGFKGWFSDEAITDVTEISALQKKLATLNTKKSVTEAKRSMMLTDVWTAAKLYSQFELSASVNSANESDPTLLFSILINCPFFKRLHSDTTEYGQFQKSCENLRDCRNEWAHAAHQQLNAENCDNVFERARQLLNCQWLCHSPVPLHNAIVAAHEDLKRVRESLEIDVQRLMEDEPFVRELLRQSNAQQVQKLHQVAGDEFKSHHVGPVLLKLLKSGEVGTTRELFQQIRDNLNLTYDSKLCNGLMHQFVKEELVVSDVKVKGDKPIYRAAPKLLSMPLPES